MAKHDICQSRNNFTLFRDVILFCVFAMNTGINAQTILLRPYPDPDCTLEYRIKSTATMDIKPGLQPDQNASANPVLMNMNLEQSILSEFGVRQADSCYPVEMKIRTSNTRITVNDNETSMPQMEALNNFTLSGYIDAGYRYHYKALTGGNLNDNQRNSIVLAMESAIKNYSFPMKRMTQGDTIIVRTPFAIPMPGIGEIKVDVIKSFVLKEIRDSISLFDIDYSFTLATESKTLKMNMNAHGNGDMIYDNKTYCIKNQRGDMDIEISIDGKASIINSKVHSYFSLDGILTKENM